MTDVERTELGPCPLAHEIQYGVALDTMTDRMNCRHSLWYIRCCDCGLTLESDIGSGYDPAELIKQWNTRSMSNEQLTSECSASTHEFKLHDWRWLGWPLSNPSSTGRWCRLCGLTQGKPEGQCQTANCLEYATGGNDFCESCQRNRAIADAATRMRDKCVEKVRNFDGEYSDGDGLRTLDPRGLNVLADELQSFTLGNGEQKLTMK